MSPAIIDHLGSTFFALASISILWFRFTIYNFEHTIRTKLFLLLLCVNATMLVLDTGFWVFNGTPGVFVGVAFVGINLLYFLFQPVGPFIWLLYVVARLHESHASVLPKKPYEVRRLAWILAIPAIFNSVITLTSPFTGAFYSIDAQNFYHRGPLFYLEIALTFPYFLVALAFIFKFAKTTPRRVRIPLLLFALPPAIAGAIQSMCYGVALIWPAMSISLLLIYLSIEADRSGTDYLTSLQNRRSFERVLARRFSDKRHNKLFGLILIDLDGFKSINDEFGHSEGDQALIQAADLLRQCLHHNDVVARYGGDEFAAIVDLQNRNDIDSISARIVNTFAAWNLTSGKSWQLTPSIGHILWSEKYPDGRSLIREVDQRMYANKRNAR